MRNLVILGTMLAASCVAQAANFAGSSIPSSLSSIVPTLGESETSVPIRWSAGMNFGWDSNVTPNGLSKESSTFINPWVNAAMSNFDTRTMYDLNATLGLNQYLEDIAGADSTFANSDVRFNLVHNINERMRFSSSNFLAWTQEQNFDFGVIDSLNTGEYFLFSTNNSLGYSYDERWASVYGAAFSLYDYIDADRLNRNITTLSHQLRYRESELRVYTLDYRYEFVGVDTGDDSHSHFLLGGVENRFSANTIGVLRAGVQLKSVEGFMSNVDLYPTVEAALNQRLNDQFGWSSSLRWSNENYGAGYSGGNYSSRNTLRAGAEAYYTLSPRLKFTGGVEGYWIDSSDADTAGLADSKEYVYNSYVGLRAELRHNMFANLRYNLTLADEGGLTTSNDYNRSRVSGGLEVVF